MTSHTPGTVSSRENKYWACDPMEDISGNVSENRGSGQLKTLKKDPWILSYLFTIIPAWLCREGVIWRPEAKSLLIEAYFIFWVHTSCLYSVSVSSPVALLKHANKSGLKEKTLSELAAQEQFITERKSRQQGFEAAGHHVSTIRRRRRNNAGCSLARFLHRLSPGSQPGNGATHSGQTFPPLLVQSR